MTPAPDDDRFRRSCLSLKSGWEVRRGWAASSPLLARFVRKPSLASRARSVEMLYHGATNSKAVKQMMLLEQYIAGWRAHDAAAILATLTPDCVVIESFGPVYRGHDWVARWVAKWLAEKGQVIDWSIHDLHCLGDREVAEWTFHYTWRGQEKSFNGITIAKICSGRISHLREYATTAALYDWRGEWPEL